MGKRGFILWVPLLTWSPSWSLTVKNVELQKRRGRVFHGHTYQTAKDSALSSLGEALPRVRSCSTRPLSRRRSCTAACCQGPTRLQQAQTHSGPGCPWWWQQWGRGASREELRVPRKGKVRHGQREGVGLWGTLGVPREIGRRRHLC